MLSQHRPSILHRPVLSESRHQQGVHAENAPKEYERYKVFTRAAISMEPVRLFSVALRTATCAVSRSFAMGDWVFVSVGLDKGMYLG